MIKYNLEDKLKLIQSELFSGSSLKSILSNFYFFTS